MLGRWSREFLVVIVQLTTSSFEMQRICPVLWNIPFVVRNAGGVVEGSRWHLGGFPYSVPTKDSDVCVWV